MILRDIRNISSPVATLTLPMCHNNVTPLYSSNLLYIYEKVAFIKVDGNNLEFYSDYDMKDKIYTIDSNKADISFINNTISFDSRDSF